MLGFVMAESSPLDRLNTLPFSAFIGMGALAGLLAVGVASWVESRAPRQAVAVPEHPTATEGADVPIPEAETAARRSRSGGAPPASDGRSDAPGPASDDDGERLEKDDQDPDEAGGGEDARADGSDGGDLFEPDVGGSAIDEPSAAQEDPEAAPDDTNAQPPTSPSRAAEAAATPEELVGMAETAFDEGRYKDAYRLATRAQREQPSDRTQMLRGRAACRIKDERNAKTIVRSFKLTDDRRKTLRTYCKEHGVRVGL